MPLTQQERDFLVNARRWMHNDLVGTMNGHANMIAALALAVYTEAFVQSVHF